jgi:hypothetical protein
MRRYKVVIGRTLRARTLPTQKTEAKIGCKVLNDMTASVCQYPTASLEPSAKDQSRSKMESCTNASWLSSCTSIFQLRRAGFPRSAPVPPSRRRTSQTRLPRQRPAVRPRSATTARRRGAHCGRQPGITARSSRSTTSTTRAATMPTPYWLAPRPSHAPAPARGQATRCCRSLPTETPRRD